MPLYLEVALSQRDFVLHGDEAPAMFGPCVLRPNGYMDQDATWYGGRPRPRRHWVL